MPELYFEDFRPGDEFRSVERTLSEREIVDFARSYDPQPFHVDPNTAKVTVFGGLIASGPQTIALTFRLFLETGTLAACSLGSPGLDEVRWRQPVRPGDTLRVVTRVVARRASKSKPDRGLVTLAYTTLNQRGETVLTMRCVQLVKRRPT
jgi:acyl dehydratase